MKKFNWTRMITITIVAALLIIGSFYYFKTVQSSKLAKDLVEDFFGFEKLFEPLFKSKNFEEINRVLSETKSHVIKSQSEIDKNIHEYYRIRSVIESIVLADRISGLDSSRGFAEQLMKELHNIKERLIISKYKFETKFYWIKKIDQLDDVLKNYRHKVMQTKRDQARNN